MGRRIDLAERAVADGEECEDEDGAQDEIGAPCLDRLEDRARASLAVEPRRSTRRMRG
jgi:hypothetical protein